MNFQRLKSVLSVGTEHLGDLVFWSLADARIDRKTLEALWAGAGLPIDLLPDPPSAERAFKLAVREAQLGQRERFIRLGLESDTEIVFAVVRERRDDEGNVSHVQEARIHLDRERETVSSDCAAHEMVQAVLTSFKVLSATHTPDDIRRAIVKALASWFSVTLRDHGGVYWVPAPHAAQLRSLQSAVEQIGGSRMYLLPVHQSADAEQALGELARGAIEAELAALQAEIAEFVSVPPERASTLVRRFDAFEALRDRARMYRTILSVEVEDIDRQVDRLSAAVEELLNKKSAA